MIVEVIASAYDATGRPTFRPRKKPFRFFAPNSPMGRYLTQPHGVRCRSLAELRAFLAGCRYVSDREQFGKDDYWMYPEDFEERRRGDCDDFSLWTWRQLLEMGYDARFVCGRAGRYGASHAWVTFDDSGRTFLVEPTAARLCAWLPRLATVRYQPSISVTWDGRKLGYFEHEPRRYDPRVADLPPLVAEWVRFWLVTRPAVWLARARSVTRTGRSALKAGPRSWLRSLGTMAGRVPRLWSRSGRWLRPRRRAKMRSDGVGCGSRPGTSTR